MRPVIGLVVVALETRTGLPQIFPFKRATLCACERTWLAVTEGKGFLGKKGSMFWRGGEARLYVLGPDLSLFFSRTPFFSSASGGRTGSLKWGEGRMAGSLVSCLLFCWCTCSSVDGGGENKPCSAMPNPWQILALGRNARFMWFARLGAIRCDAMQFDFWWADGGGGGRGKGRGGGGLVG